MCSLEFCGAWASEFTFGFERVYLSLLQPSLTTQMLASHLHYNPSTRNLLIGMSIGMESLALTP
jgi:hypothetical protein